MHAERTELGPSVLDPEGARTEQRAKPGTPIDGI